MPDSDILVMLAVVYVLPALLVCVGFYLKQRLTDTEAGRVTVPWAEAPFVGICFLVGFYCLEARWPWDMIPVVRSSEWFPLGIAFTVGAALAWEGGGRVRLVGLPLLSVMTVAFLLLLLRPYWFQLRAETWSRPMHLWALAGLLAMALANQFALAHACEKGSGPFAMVIVCASFSVAACYAFQGASSAKVAQWLLQGAVLAAALFFASIVTGWSRRAASLGWLLGAIMNGALLYGLYAADKPTPAPVVSLLMASWGAGIFYRGRVWLAVGSWVLLFLALAVILMMRDDASGSAHDQKDDGYLDIYGVRPGSSSMDRLLVNKSFAALYR